MPLSNGTRLGGYEILSALGAGGMGEVYRARDTRLDRHVAIKILPQAFFADAERVARFQREAKVLASLNHPHIAAIYGLHDEADGVRALIMELVEGEDLARRLTRGAIPLDEALPIANQIAEALEAAHGQGIIHRDLKPANIKVRPDGTVKVLDFGLAKAVVSDAEMPDLADSPTVTAVATRAGIILGTAPYMSPEQAKGRRVDRRTDLWAFGAVLYELLTGTRAFQGESVTETLAHVLTHTPNWALLPANTPAPIRTLLRRCLEKNPKKRLDSAVALRLEIDDALASPAGVTAPVSTPLAQRRRVSWQAIVAVVAASLITALGTWAVTRSAPPAPALAARFTLTFPPTEPMELTGLGRDIAVSPDGRYLVYQSSGRLVLRALDQLDVVPLSNVRGRTPFFSPDSRWIGFFDGGELKKVAVTGEPVIPLSREMGNSLGGSGTWGDDGTIVVSSVSSADRTVGLRRVSADGGEVTVLTRIDGPDVHMRPSMLPGGRGVLFTISSTSDRRLAVLDLKSGQQKTVVPHGFSGQYLDTGHLIYAMAGSQGSGGQVFATLWVVGFDLDRLETRGEAVRVGEALQADMLSATNFAVSRSGVLAYVPARERLRSIVWVDRTTKRETAIDALPPGPYATLGLSPDETRVAFALEDREAEIFAYDFARQSKTQLTFDRSWEFLPRWRPDSQRIVFMSDRAKHAGPTNLYSVAADGSGEIERLTDSKNMQWPNSITKDGTLLLAELQPENAYDIFRLPSAAPHGADTASRSDERRSEPTALVSEPLDQYAANISPNGRYFAYQSSDADGRFAVYVQPYPDAGRRWKISPGGGTAPVWARTERELFYIDESNTLMAVRVDISGPEFSAGKPAKVFDTKYWGDFYSYDVARDGRFLMLKDAGQNQASIVVVLNWFEEVRRRMPTR
jgi:serine/threonine-protein kinase